MTTLHSLHKHSICGSTAKLQYTNVLYTNVRSLTRGAKRDELKMLIDNHEIDIIGISETCGKADILDIEMEIPGFKLYRKDRATINNKKGGGVALYVKNKLQSLECND